MFIFAFKLKLPSCTLPENPQGAPVTAKYSMKIAKMTLMRRSISK